MTGDLPGRCPRIHRLAEIARWNAYKARYYYTRWLEKRRELAQRLYAKWRCIHEYEGAWDSNTGNGYYGGLQMDLGFQKAYGPEFYAR